MACAAGRGLPRRRQGRLGPCMARSKPDRWQAGRPARGRGRGWQRPPSPLLPPHTKATLTLARVASVQALCTTPALPLKDSSGGQAAPPSHPPPPPSPPALTLHYTAWYCTTRYYIAWYCTSSRLTRDPGRPAPDGEVLLNQGAARRRLELGHGVEHTHVRGLRTGIAGTAGRSRRSGARQRARCRRPGGGCRQLCLLLAACCLRRRLLNPLPCAFPPLPPPALSPHTALDAPPHPPTHHRVKAGSRGAERARGLRLGAIFKLHALDEVCSHGWGIVAAKSEWKAFLKALETTTAQASGCGWLWGKPGWRAQTGHTQTGSGDRLPASGSLLLPRAPAPPGTRPANCHQLRAYSAPGPHPSVLRMQVLQLQDAFAHPPGSPQISK